MTNLLRALRLWATADTRNERGATGAEYAVLVLFVAAVIIMGATALGIAIDDALNDAAGLI